MSRAVRTIEHRPPQEGMPALELVRSTRRRRSASAFPRDGVVVVQLPAGMPTAEEERMIRRLVGRVTGQARVAGRGGDVALTERALVLADRYVDGVRPSSVGWSSRMRRRWGSATAGDGTIRISDRLAAMPDYVLDYVLVHELAHLVVPDHSPRFHAILERYPATARAQGFLAGIEFADARASLPPEGPGDSAPSSDR